MIGVNAPRTRRRRIGAAAAAYNLALTVLGDQAEAEIVASVALRRGAHSRIAVIAHARHQALQRTESAPTTDLNEAAALDLRELAHQLGGTRPPIERALVDLELRFGLDHASFARTLGISPGRAAERAQLVAATWQDELDPAMLAWLGPGSCDGLAAVLIEAGAWPQAVAGGTTTTLVQPQAAPNGQPLLPTGTEPAIDPVLLTAGIGTTSTVKATSAVTVGMILALVPAVRAHVATCDACHDRLEAMTSVRTLAGQMAIDEVPRSVATAARAARRRIPNPAPPSIEPRRLELGRLRAPALAMLVIAAVAVGTFGIIRTVNDDGSGSQASRVAKLVESAPSSHLLGTPTIITPSTKTAALANNGSEAILWHASTSAPWLRVEPSSGRLMPAQTISLRVTTSGEPRSPSTATLTITGSDGSVQTLRYDPQP